LKIIVFCSKAAEINSFLHEKMHQTELSKTLYDKNNVDNDSKEKSGTKVKTEFCQEWLKNIHGF
jgi:hypothetical protein